MLTSASRRARNSKDKKQLFKQENICMKYLRHLAPPGSCKNVLLSNAFHFLHSQIINYFSLLPTRPGGSGRLLFCCFNSSLSRLFVNTDKCCHDRSVINPVNQPSLSPAALRTTSSLMKLLISRS